MTFSEALEAMKGGSPVGRAVWNIQPQVMRLGLVEPDIAGGVVACQFIGLFTAGLQTLHVVSDEAPFVAQGNNGPPDLVPWTPSQQDMLSDDWFVDERITRR